MDNTLEKQKVTFQQNVNRFIGYGITSAIIYTFFYAPFAFFFILPLMLWGLSTPLQMSKNYFIEKEKKISLFESIILVLLFASAYAIYLLLINSLGISLLYYGAENFDDMDIFIRLISAPIMEEIIFRGFGLGILKQYGKGFSIVATALLFALLHTGIRVVMVIPSAVMYGIIMVLTKNIIFPILLHMIINAWVLGWASFNILAQLFSKNQVVEHWINVPVTLALNSALVLIALIILWKRPFFKELLSNCKLSNIVASMKRNKKVYLNFFALKSVKCYLIITIVASLYNITRAILELI